MNRHAARLALILSPLVWLVACSAAPQQRTTRLLDERLRTQLAKEVEASKAVVEKVPGGARVTLFEASSFPNNAKSLDDQAPDIRADVIEGLLDPSLMRVQVTDTTALPQDQKDLRVGNVERYFIANGLGSVLVPSETAPAGSGPGGLVITVGVQCPPPNGHAGYGDGRSHPVCE